jgi:uncharacterized protein YaaQ
MSNKLVIAIVQNDDAEQVVAALREAGFASTKTATTGGFLRQGNTTLLVGTEAERVPAALALIQRNGRVRMQQAPPMPAVAGLGEPHMGDPLDLDYVTPLPIASGLNERTFGGPRDVQVGGAVVFVLDVERTVRC